MTETMGLTLAATNPLESTVEIERKNMSTPYKDASVIASTTLITNYVGALKALHSFLVSAEDAEIQEFEALKYLIEDHYDDLEIPLLSLNDQLSDVAARLENRKYEDNG